MKSIVGLSPVYMRLIGVSMGVFLLFVCGVKLSGDFPATYATYQSKQALIDTLDQAPSILEDQATMMLQLQQRWPQAAENQHLATTALGFGAYLSQQCGEQGLQLVSLPQESPSTAPGYQVITARFSVAGPLADMLGLLYQLEARDRIGRLTQAHFFRQAIRQGGRRKVVLVGEVEVERGDSANR